MIYLDNNATTRVAPETAEAMNRFLGASFGNPSSSHTAGVEARRAVEAAREAVASLLGACSSEIVFTSGGTESDNWAILGALAASPSKRHVVTTRVEHEAVRKLCERLESSGRCEVTWLDVDSEGALDLDELRRSLRKDTAIVSIMAANNETGILFPIEEAARIVKQHSDALFHTDAVNAAGKIAIDVSRIDVDLLSISGHKFHAPKGVGALYIRRGVALEPLLVGGGQESSRRAGTEAVHQIVGLGAASRLVSDLAPMERIRQMRDRLERELLERIPDTYLNGTSDPARRLPNTLSLSFERANGEIMLARLDKLGVCVSTGSACNSESRTASPVLAAMDVPYSRAMGSIRFSLCRFNVEDDIDRVLEYLPPIVAAARTFAGE